MDQHTVFGLPSETGFLSVDGENQMDRPCTPFKVSHNIIVVLSTKSGR